MVNISSGAATRARPGAAHYCTSKAALEMATKACAVEFAERGIRVNAVAPGFVEVDSPVNPVTEEYAAAVSVNPIGRPGTSRRDRRRRRLARRRRMPRFVTGAVLRVDGGATAGTAALPLHHPAPRPRTRPAERRRPEREEEHTVASPPRSYVIVGAGAIGGTLGHHLARAGHPVTVVDADAEHVAAHPRGRPRRGARRRGAARARVARAVTPDRGRRGPRSSGCCSR